MTQALERDRGLNRPNFDRLAGLYRWMEWLSFGPCLWWCRTAFLPQVARSHRALALGDGDGRFTARLLAINPAVRVDAVDLSPVMLSRLKQNAGVNADRVRTIVADVRAWTPDPADSFDVVYTHFFLDCLSSNEVRELARRVAAVLEPAGAWVVSEFAIPRSGPGHWLGLPLVSFLYRAFGLLTGLAVRRLPDYPAALQSAGLTMRAQKKWLFSVLTSEYWTRQSGT